MASSRPAPLYRRLRRCPPVESPLPPRALLRAALETLSGRDTRAALVDHLQRRFSADHVVLFGSGTQALTGAIDTALSGAADRVVALPAFGCYDLATAAVGAAARVRLYDVDPETLGPDWTSFEAALAAGAGAAVVAPLYAYPVDWNRAQEIARRYGTVLIEDAAQSTGGEYHGRPLGSLGTLAVLSFGRGKGWTGAGGGALLVRGLTTLPAPAPARPLSSLRALLASWAQMLLARPRLYAIPASLPWLHLGETRYRDPAPLRGISRYSAALTRATAQAALNARAARAEHAAHIHAAIADLPPVSIIDTRHDAVAGFLRCALRVPAGVRDGLLRELERDGVAPSYPLPLFALPALRAASDASRATLPGAAQLARELVTIPVHAHVRPDLAAAVRAALVRLTQTDSSDT